VYFYLLITDCPHYLQYFDDDELNFIWVTYVAHTLQIHDCILIFSWSENLAWKI